LRASATTSTAIRAGETVVDLGSGSGMDTFLAARQVGAAGRVIGIDMTEAQLEKATGLARAHGIANAEFRNVRIEQLPLDDASADLAISNGVVNLSPAKDRVFAEVARALRPEGERPVPLRFGAGRERNPEVRRQERVAARGQSLTSMTDRLNCRARGREGG
jgi:ubiquinone/menaquinone biosynthesis C-methylase UbiE